MRVTVDLVGGETAELEAEAPTYADCIRAVGLSPEAATAMVDGQPVPSDAEVAVEEVRVLRLISGG